jgi:hypothetical protein
LRHCHDGYALPAEAVDDPVIPDDYFADGLIVILWDYSTGPWESAKHIDSCVDPGGESGGVG